MVVLLDVTGFAGHCLHRIMEDPGAPWAPAVQKLQVGATPEPVPELHIDQMWMKRGRNIHLSTFITYSVWRRTPGEREWASAMLS